MNISVTSVSKKQQTIWETPAASFVITQEEIRRSGATSIPEVLRLVPGLQVARISSHKWAISSRGFNGKFSDKLLVMMDGRTLYTPLFSGVEWDSQDTMLEDIDRIEVIRGPGATMWGANAVNGVIHIITKPAKETQGGLVTAGGGDHENGFGGFRYGAQLGSKAFVRGYAKYFRRDHLHGANGDSNRDQWGAARGGFRLDWDLSERDALTLQGDLYQNGMNEWRTAALITPPYSLRFHDEETANGQNILARWKRRLSGASDFALQYYYDRNHRDKYTLGQARDTVDIDFQHRLAVSEGHEVLWGAGYRRYTDAFRNTFQITFQPASRATDLMAAFIQDEISLQPDRLKLTLGSKFEHHDFMGLQIQPAARLYWTPHRRHSLWLGVSRAVATPARANRDMRVNVSVFPTGPGRPLGMISLIGKPDLRTSRLLAFEAGYRGQLSKRFSIDFAAFHNRYGNLEFVESGAPFLEREPAPAHTVTPLSFHDEIDGETAGVETLATWHATRVWRLIAAHSLLKINMRPDARGRSFGLSEERSSPRHQGQFRSALDLHKRFEWDTTLYYVGALPALEIPAYLRLDSRIGWSARGGLEFSLVGQNLLNDRHLEFLTEDSSAPRTYMGRAAYGKITWRF